MRSCFKRNGLQKQSKSNNNGKSDSKSKSNNNGNGNGKLTANQKIFANEWLIDRNGTRAYKVAYPKTKSNDVAACCASIYLRKSKIESYINARLEIIKEKAEINQDWVLERLKRLSEYCVSDFFNDDGSMKLFSEIPKEKLYAVGGFKQTKRKITTQDKVIIEDRIKEFKLSDKRAVLGDIGRYLGMFAKDNEQKNKGPGSSVAVIGQNIQINLIEE